MIYSIYKIKALCLAFVLCFVLSCKNKSHLNIPSSNLIVGNLIPIKLNSGETIIPSSDLVINESLIDSVSARPYLYVALSDDKKNIVLKETGAPLPPMFYLKIYSGTYEYSVLLLRSQKTVHEFRYMPLGTPPDTVQVAGDFNGWTPRNTQLTFDGKEFRGKVSLSPGKYAYQLVIDGKWTLDPGNPNKADNNIGGVNSIIEINRADREKAPQLRSKWASGDIIRIEAFNAPEKYFVLWNNFDLTASFTSFNDGIIEIKIPAVAANMWKSSIRVYSYNQYGCSNDILIPIKSGNVVKQSADLNRFDRNAMIIYFMMVDRFKDGNPNNNLPVKDKEVAVKANYMGGDIEGIKQEINQGYFNALGVNTLWLSPVIQNPKEAYTEYPEPHRKYSGYHGYWPVSSTTVDYRLGDEAVLQSTIEDAHKKGINILLDFVSNHVHEKHPMYVKHPDWFTSIDLPDGRKNIRLWDEHRITTWFDTFLPDIDYTKPEAVQAMSDSAMYWIKKYQIDGFRHDATKHVSEDFWRALTKKIKLYALQNQVPLPYQIGETFGSRELIDSYVNNGEQNAQFDFNLYFDARSVFINDNESFTKLNESLQESFSYYGWHSLMGNISGNHDIARFISYAGGDLSFKEDDKEAGWKRNIQVKNKVGYKKLAQLMAYIATIPGVPVIYYGDELGMPGAGDPDNRRMMEFKNLNDDELNQLKVTQNIFNLRKHNMALIFGDYAPLKVNESFMAYGRYYFDHSALVFFNKSNKTIKQKIILHKGIETALLKKNFNSNFSLQNNTLIIELQPYSFEIITSN